MMTIRPATRDDIQILRHFEQGIVHAERPFDDTLRAGAIQYYDLEAMITDERVRFLIAESDGTPVGCGFARLEPAKPYERHTTQAYLGLMYVEPAFRGRAINGQIVEALKSWCLDQGVSELRLQVYSDNVAALGAYRRIGFEPRVVEMRLRVLQR
jgi:GNAT superfamily N-acetyltransferase